MSDGYAARGTTRQATRVAEIEASGAQAAVADPNRLGTLLPEIEGLAAICWLMGSAVGEPELIAALHGPRLESLLEKLVDTPVRGFVYEAGGTVQRTRLDAGAEIASEAGERWRVPVQVVAQDPADHATWLGAMTAAVARVLAGG